jgi:hypothetical protein
MAGLILLAGALMVIGHVVISGHVFDPITGETYNVFTRWVSDYAGKPGEGTWVKCGILAFAVACLLLHRSLSLLEATSRAGVARALLVQVLGTLIVGGLLLVAVFDISPRQFEVIEDQQVLGEAARLRAGTAGPQRSEDAESSLLGILSPDGPTLREEIYREVLALDAEDPELVEHVRAVADDPAAALATLRRWRIERSSRPDDMGAPATLTRLPISRRHAAKERHHRLGFRLFLIGFLGSSGWLAWREARGRRYDRLPGTLLLLLLSVVFGVWLFVQNMGLAGIPQRALLGLIAVWAWRARWHLRPTEVSGPA